MQRTLLGKSISAIKALFRAAVAITRRDPDAPQPTIRKRRGGKQGGGLIMGWKPMSLGQAVARGRYAAFQFMKTERVTGQAGNFKGITRWFANAADEAAYKSLAVVASDPFDLADPLSLWSGSETSIDFVDDHSDIQQSQYIPEP